MLLLYTLCFLAAVMLTFVVQRIKIKRIKTLIDQYHEKEKAKENEAGKEGSDKDSTAT